MTAALRGTRMLAALITLATLMTLTAAPGAAHAQDATALRARALAATCAQCHGTDGRSAETGSAAVPSLAGLPAAQLVAQMTAFKNGTRSGTVMPQLAKGFSDAQIAQLAAWFAAAPTP